MADKNMDVTQNFYDIQKILEINIDPFLADQVDCF